MHVPVTGFQRTHRGSAGPNGSLPGLGRLVSHEAHHGVRQPVHVLRRSLLPLPVPRGSPCGADARPEAPGFLQAHLQALGFGFRVRVVTARPGVLVSCCMALQCLRLPLQTRSASGCACMQLLWADLEPHNRHLTKASPWCCCQPGARITMTMLSKILHMIGLIHACKPSLAR